MTAAAAAPIANTSTPDAPAGAEKAALAAVPDPKTPEAKPPEPKPETVKPPEKPAEPKESVGQAFARLARAERVRVEKERAAKAEIEAERSRLAAEKAEAQRLRDEAQAFRDAEARAKADPGAHLERLLGKDWYEKLTEYRLAGGKTPPDLAVRAAEEKFERGLADLRREQEELRKRDAEDRQKAIEAEKARAAEEQKALIEQFNAETVDFVKAHPDDYELTHLYEQFDLVPEVIREHFQQTKRVLSAKEAADLVEKHFEEQVEKAGQTRKLGPKFAKPADTKPEEPVRPAPTLSNATAAAPGFAGAPKNEEERIARAIAAMEAAQAKTRTA